MQTYMFQAGLTAQKSSPTKLTGCCPSEIMQWRSPSIVKYKSLLSTQWWSNINNSLPSTPSGAWKYVHHLYPYILLLNYTMQGLHSTLTTTHAVTMVLYQTQYIWNKPHPEASETLSTDQTTFHPPLLVPGSPLHPTTPSCYARFTFYLH